MDPREKREDESWAEYGARVSGMGGMLAGGDWGDYAPDIKGYAEDKGWVDPSGFGSFFLDPTKDLNLLPDVPPGGQYHSAVDPAQVGMAAVPLAAGIRRPGGRGPRTLTPEQVAVRDANRLKVENQQLSRNIQRIAAEETPVQSKSSASAVKRGDTSLQKADEVRRKAQAAIEKQVTTGGKVVKALAPFAKAVPFAGGLYEALRSEPVGAADITEGTIPGDFRVTQAYPSMDNVYTDPTAMAYAGVTPPGEEFGSSYAGPNIMGLTEVAPSMSGVDYSQALADVGIEPTAAGMADVDFERFLPGEDLGMVDPTWPDSGGLGKTTTVSLPEILSYALPVGGAAKVVSKIPAVGKALTKAQQAMRRNILKGAAGAAGLGAAGKLGKEAVERAIAYGKTGVETFEGIRSVPIIDKAFNTIGWKNVTSTGPKTGTTISTNIAKKTKLKPVDKPPQTPYWAAAPVAAPVAVPAGPSAADIERQKQAAVDARNAAKARQDAINAQMAIEMAARQRQQQQAVAAEQARQAQAAQVAHQAQQAAAQQALQDFYSSRAWQEEGAAVPAGLIDVATQVDTFAGYGGPMSAAEINVAGGMEFGGAGGMRGGDRGGGGRGGPGGRGR